MKQSKEITVDAVEQSLPAVAAIVEELLEAAGCPLRVQAQIGIAVDELFSNIVRYAYAPGTGRATLRAETQDAPPSVTLTFTDRGVAYNPLEKADPDVTLSAEERDIGGLGIYMVKKSMDEVCYQRRDGQNILTVRKNWV